jgi:hypothetical protein
MVKNIAILTLLFISLLLLNEKYNLQKKFFSIPATKKVINQNITPPPKSNCQFEIKKNKDYLQFKNNKKVMDMINKDCMYVFDAFQADLKNDNSRVLVIDMVPTCVSCHYRSIYVFDKDKIIFEEGFNEPKISTSKLGEIGSMSDNQNVLDITYNLMKRNESYSNVSAGIKTSYLWSSDGEHFWAVDQRPIIFQQ